MNAGTPLANEFVTVYESPDAATIYCNSPGIARTPSGRVVATLDLGGPGTAGMSETSGLAAREGVPGLDMLGRIYTSDDRGRTWTHRGDFAGMHARPFCAGGRVYVLGHRRHLIAIRSDDDGTTWSETRALTTGGYWHQAPCNVHYARDSVYLVMERLVRDARASHASAFAPVLMRATFTDDLTDPNAWTYASELVFQEAVPLDELDWHGVPFFNTQDDGVAPTPEHPLTPLGWLETNVVQFVDPDHQWHDPAGRTFHLYMRAYTGGTGYAAVAKVAEHEDGSMVTSLQRTPSGRRVALLPLPGGQMKFHILYDESSPLYWLLSSHATDSMTRPDRLASDRFDLPNNERHRLQLHFSRNCVDWSFAGIVAAGASAVQSRHYASMVVDGDDLHVLSRSGDARARSAHDVNLITFHTVNDFRSLVY
ncbi:exo-alpha-sialidase [Candidatus Poribacteria bacterium]|jgi:hypothetical protein|nr:exo-alpha-sialidase [Candidatus Poribacteria bacterium]MBT5532700.1 exo-alpha-sialidase [Candidatus Poribacteria bacterium]MBT5711430.1 exo-alpha-sialidase [Candidatus Poribacteria bacterium]MBT7099097.1 exo-alpha-sialidase [Candidatus Poribacteria bacterium]MBT7805868.1 exo-alpha-sialidase [Candidatus Poribacteria bacterium]